jgi:hypothetical protein
MKNIDIYHQIRKNPTPPSKAFKDKSKYSRKEKFKKENHD